jgi:DnaJ family protein A protein 2
MPTKLYDVLGVDKDATPDTIKKAYRKKAMKHHPDKGGDEESFKKINEAFEVLNDPKKKRQYDSGTQNTPFTFNGHDPFDVFKNFFGAEDPFGHMHNPFGHHQRAQSNHLKKVSLLISLDDLYNGKQTTLKISRQGCCTGCNGKGGTSSHIVCLSCGGAGKVRRVIQLGPGMMQQSIGTCPDCDGQGSRIPPADICQICSGAKTIEVIETLSLTIKKGTRSGEQILLKNQGDYDTHRQTHEDLILILEQKPHSRFQRKDNDLLVEINVPLFNCITDASLKYHHIDSKEYILKTDSQVITPESYFRVKGFGMPIHNKTSQFGHLLIKFNVIFPQNLISHNVSVEDALVGKLVNADLPVKKLEFFVPQEDSSRSNTTNCAQQ